MVKDAQRSLGSEAGSDVLQVRLLLGLGEVEERVVVLGSRDEKSLVALDEVALEVVVGDLVSHRAEEQRPGDSDEPGEGCGQQFLPVLG